MVQICMSLCLGLAFIGSALASGEASSTVQSATVRGLKEAGPQIPEGAEVIEIPWSSKPHALPCPHFNIRCNGVLTPLGGSNAEDEGSNEEKGQKRESSKRSDSDRTFLLAFRRAHQQRDEHILKLNAGAAVTVSDNGHAELRRHLSEDSGSEDKEREKAAHESRDRFFLPVGVRASHSEGEATSGVVNERVMREIQGRTPLEEESGTRAEALGIEELKAEGFRTVFLRSHAERDMLIGVQDQAPRTRRMRHGIRGRQFREVFGAAHRQRDAVVRAQADAQFSLRGAGFKRLFNQEHTKRDRVIRYHQRVATVQDVEPTRVSKVGDADFLDTVVRAHMERDTQILADKGSFLEAESMSALSNDKKGGSLYSARSAYSDPDTNSARPGQGYGSTVPEGVEGASEELDGDREEEREIGEDKDVQQLQRIPEYLLRSLPSEGSP